MWLPQIFSGLVGANLKKSVSPHAQPIKASTNEIALTKAEESLAAFPDMPFIESEKAVRERLTKILDVVESRDYSHHSDTLRPLLYDIENPTEGGVYIKGTPSFSWNWKYQSAIDEKKDTKTYKISLSNGMGDDKVNIMTINVTTTLSGRIKSLDAKYHIDCGLIMNDFVEKRSELDTINNIGTRHIDMDFTDGSRVDVIETEYFLDLLKEEEITYEKLKRFLIGTPIIYPPLIKSSSKQK